MFYLKDILIKLPNDHTRHARFILNNNFRI